jgi:hypothetical protein
MTTPIEELKIRAKLLRKALDNADQSALERAHRICKKRRWTVPQQWPLSKCLNLVAAESGFGQWDHARRVLGGEAARGGDMGTLWHDERCIGMINDWYAGYADARAARQAGENRYLLPYARQFIVAEAAFIEALGLAPAGQEWVAIGRDLAAGYGTPAWQALALQRLVAMRRS